MLREGKRPARQAAPGQPPSPALPIAGLPSRRRYRPAAHSTLAGIALRQAHPASRKAAYLVQIVEAAEHKHVLRQARFATRWRLRRIAAIVVDLVTAGQMNNFLRVDGCWSNGTGDGISKHVVDEVAPMVPG